MNSLVLILHSIMNFPIWEARNMTFVRDNLFIRVNCILILWQKSLKLFSFFISMFSGPGVGSSRLGLRTTVAIIFGRLVLVPPAGLGIVTLADKLGFLPEGDKMFKFVLLLQHTMPTSVLSGNRYRI